MLTEAKKEAHRGAGASYFIHAETNVRISRSAAYYMADFGTDTILYLISELVASTTSILYP